MIKYDKAVTAKVSQIDIDRLNYICLSLEISKNQAIRDLIRQKHDELKAKAQPPAEPTETKPQD